MRFRFTPFILQALACIVLFCALAHSRPVNHQAVLVPLASRDETEKIWALYLIRQRIGTRNEHWGFVSVKTQPQSPSAPGTLIHAINSRLDKNKPLETSETVWYVNTRKPDPELTQLALHTEVERQKVIAKLKAIHMKELPVAGGNCIDYVRLGAKALVEAELMKENAELNKLTNPQGVYKEVHKAVWG